MTQVTCKCGKQFVKGTQICPWCGADVGSFEGEDAKVADTKANHIIQVQIRAKEAEFENANGYGPTICILIGVFGFFMVFPLLFLVGGIIWAIINNGTRTRIAGEINILKAQLEA